MKGHYQKVPSTKKTFPEPKATEQYEGSVGPERPSEMERIKQKLAPVTENRFIKGAISAVAARSAQVAHEIRESPAKERREHRGGRRRESYDMPFPAPPADPFGVTGFGMPGYREEREPSPRRRRKRQSNGGSSRQPPYPQMFGVPKHMRHLF